MTQYGQVVVNDEGKVAGTEVPVWRWIEATRLLREAGLVSDEPTELELAFTHL
jgi:hypothetical protein